MRIAYRLALIAIAASLAGCTVTAVDRRPYPPPGVAQQHMVYRYFGAHVIPYAFGGGWCFIDGVHDHEYPPENPNYYRYESGVYHYSAPIMVTYYDVHPDPWGHWCYMEGPHSHDYYPPRDNRNYFYYDRDHRHYVYRASGSAPQPPADYRYQQRGNSTYSYPGGGRGNNQGGGYSYQGGNSQQQNQQNQSGGGYTYGNNHPGGQQGNNNNGNNGGQGNNGPGSPRPGSPSFGAPPSPSAHAQSPFAPATPPRPFAPAGVTPPPAAPAPAPAPLPQQRETVRPPDGQQQRGNFGQPAPSSFRPQPPRPPPAVQPAPSKPKPSNDKDKNDGKRKLRF